ncbi:Ff.00g039610.m01.CDS01 [Fusarium sp. VM40]|nr:Ff.00g039610.m01.CDS01 [Fusarium sp. VM40]
MPPLKVIIVGGGLAGACLASGLINNSNGQVDVRVFEHDEDGSDKGGYQIRLGAHALIGFKACLTEKQYRDLLLCFGKLGGVVSSAPCIFSPSDLKVLIDLSKAPIYEKSAPIARLRLRNFLQAPLRQLNVIAYGKKFVRYEVLQNSNIRLHFQDDSHQDCEVLVSAGGSGSRMNKQIGLDNILTKVRPGDGGLLGKCHLPWPVLRSLPRQLLEKGTIYTGNSKAMVFAAVYLPESLSSAKQTTDNKDTDDDLKPKNYDEEEASLFLGMSWTTGPSSSEIPDIKDKKALMRQKLAEAGFHPDFSSLVDAVDNEALMKTPWRYAKSDTPVNWRQLLLAKDENKSNPDMPTHECG